MVQPMKNGARVRCLILACGNTLRGDDGVGPWLCNWAAERYAGDARIRAIWRQQWAPDLAHDIARADAVLFIDSSVVSKAGVMELTKVHSARRTKPSTHHLDAAQLLALARDLYSAAPRSAVQLTIGAGTLDFGEGFSAEVQRALPHAHMMMEEAVQDLLRSGQRK